jgi:hypothetical protein
MVIDDKLRSAREWLLARSAELRVEAERLRVVPYAAQCGDCAPDA